MLIHDEPISASGTPVVGKLVGAAVIVETTSIVVICPATKGMNRTLAHAGRLILKVRAVI
jgi:hypothetical protein